MTIDKPSGEMDLDRLILGMEPVLHPQTYVFATVDHRKNCEHLSPVLQFRESEGKSLILTRETALGEGIAFEFPCRMITLNVHSALEAVGFLARITQRLAGLSMGVNPVSGFYHDHLFIPEDRAEDAMNELQKMIDGK